MTLSPESEAFLEAAAFGLAIWGALFGKAQDDEDVAECHDVVLDTLSDADKIRTIDLHTGKNLRDQLTVEQAIQLDQERTERRTWYKRN